MPRDPCVYIMASRRNGTLYTGVTSDIGRCAHDHRTGALPGFTRAYECKTLVWYERPTMAEAITREKTMAEAITREKQIKAGSRGRKLGLIEAMNPDWADLYDSLA